MSNAKEPVAPFAGTTALIPAAGAVSDGILALSNVSSPAMIPVAGRPVIHRTLDYLIGIGIRDVRIGVARRGLFLEELVEANFGHRCDVEFILVSPDVGVGDAIGALLPDEPAPRYMVVFGDTLFRMGDPAAVVASPRPVLFVDDVYESYRWLTITRDDDGAIADLTDKQPGFDGPYEAAIGVLYLPDGTVLHDALSAPDREIGSTGFRDLLESVTARVGRIDADRVEEWLDCGNPDRQADAQRTLLQERAFNSIEVDPLLGTITKRSEAREKFLNELNYLRLVPPDLQVLFPRLLDYDDAWDGLSITMEFYGYPTLAELFVFENVDPGIWHRVFQHLRTIVVEKFGSRTRPLPAGACRAIYVDKVRERLGGWGDGDVGKLADVDKVVVNGETLPGLRELLGRVDQVVDRLEASGRGTIIHGDLCFGNVLYDLRSSICKLIDPRGSFGDNGLYGDPRYDVAKLWHSIDGGYDLIVADLFNVEVASPGEYTFDVLSRTSHDAVAEAFERVFFDGEFDRSEIDLITGLIFLGLPALHYDAPGRQLAFALRGMQMTSRALDALGTETP